jgi:hypothetical protein
VTIAARIARGSGLRAEGVKRSRYWRSAGTAPADVGDQDLGRAARQPGRVVVLGVPEAVVAEAIGQLRQIGRAAQRLCRGGAALDRRQIKEGDRSCHCGVPFAEIVPVRRPAPVGRRSDHDQG